MNLIKYNKKAQNSLKITKEDYDNTFRFVPERPLKSIAFNVKFNSRPGENVWVLGSIPEFGNWHYLWVGMKEIFGMGKEQLKEI